MRGFRLPYSSYGPAEVRDVIAHKRNNIAAIIICADGMQEYLASAGYDASVEAINELYDEIAKFCSYGLLGIGYFGISVEDGMPKRVDSVGNNVGKLYGSAYENMTGEEYAKMDRVESMLLDQRDNRRFLQYIKSMETNMINTMSNVFDERNSEDPAIVKCLEFDTLFTKIAVCVGRGGERVREETYSVGAANRITDELMKIVAPYRRLLEDDRVTNIRDYTMTDLKPVKPRRALI